MKVKLNDITLGERAREDYGDIDGLGESMGRLGQIQPIVIDEDNIIRAGGRRYTAAILLGWEEIDCVYMKDINTLERN